MTNKKYLLQSFADDAQNSTRFHVQRNPWVF